MHDLRLTRRVLIAFILALGLNYCFAEPSALGRYEVALAPLKERYRLNGIYVTGDQLSGFYRHLTNPSSRKQLNLEPEPIPIACKLLEDYLNQIFPQMFNSASRVSFVQIDFVKGRAYVKRNNDTTGTLQELPWAVADVLVIAILIDKLLTGSEATRLARNAIENQPTDFQSHWNKVPGILADPYGSEIERGIFFRGLSEAIKKNPGSLSPLRKLNERAYSEISVFSENLKLIEEKLVERIPGSISGQPPSNTVWALNSSESISIGLSDYAKAIDKTLVEQAVRALNLERVSSFDAAELVRVRLVPAYANSVTELRTIDQIPLNRIQQNMNLPGTFQLNSVEPKFSPASIFRQKVDQPNVFMNQMQGMSPNVSVDVNQQIQMQSNVPMNQPTEIPSSVNINQQIRMQSNVFGDQLTGMPPNLNVNSLTEMPSNLNVNSLTGMPSNLNVNSLTGMPPILNINVNPPKVILPSLPR